MSVFVLTKDMIAKVFINILIKITGFFRCQEAYVMTKAGRACLVGDLATCLDQNAAWKLTENTMKSVWASKLMDSLFGWRPVF